ncbi:MAG: hypothetical protein RLZZ236_516 [Bacteroidota bacterium]|jgi:hypothetical protein
MFLNYLKNLFLKYTLRNKWQEVSSLASTNTIQTIGLLIDGSDFDKKESLIQELIANGFIEKNISVINYSDKLSKNEIDQRLIFNSDSMNWNGEITNQVIDNFIQTKFDLLISYYVIEKPILLVITNQSKAQFKVGFSSIDKRLNHLLISTTLEKQSVFVQELFKYLKILNKIDL